jgi:hypothetical protein
MRFLELRSLQGGENLMHLLRPLFGTSRSGLRCRGVSPSHPSGTCRQHSSTTELSATFVSFEGRFPWGLRKDLSNGDGGDLAVLDARYDEVQKLSFQTERHGALGMQKLNGLDLYSCG